MNQPHDNLNETPNEKPYDVIAVGNPLTDIEININETDFAGLGLVKKSMTLLSADERKATLDKFAHYEKKYSSGGSAANSLYDMSQAGEKKFNLGLMGFLADDAIGKTYLSELRKKQIDFLVPLLNSSLNSSTLNSSTQQSGTSIILITPDGERTMRTTLGCASDLIAEKIDFDLIKKTKILYLEGYLFNGAANLAVLKRMMALVRESGVKLAFTCSDAFCVMQQPEIFLELLREADIFFANREEALALLGYDREDDRGFEEVINELQEKYPASKRSALRVITGGSEGAYLIQGAGPGQVREFIPTHPVKLVDSTGAGDAYAAGVLYSYLAEKSEEKTLPQMGQLATDWAVQVITKYGARI